MRVIVFGLTYVCVPHATCAQEKNLNKTKGFESWVTEWTCDRSSAFRMGQHWVEKPAAMERRKKENGILSRGNSSSCTRHNLENKFKKKQNKKTKTTNFSIKGRQFVSDPNFWFSPLCVDLKKDPNLLGLLFFFLPLSIFGRFQSLWAFFFFLWMEMHFLLLSPSIWKLNGAGWLVGQWIDSKTKPNKTKQKKKTSF